MKLQLENLCFEGKEGEALLSDISATLESGPLTMVMGPNGAGKSLLLRLCHGLLTPGSGSVRWTCDRKQITPPVQAMVFQTPVMLRRTALANILFALSLTAISRSGRRSRALTALQRVGLEAMADRPAFLLSGGERQRLALARAWATEPQVLFLDEPTANLDPASTSAVEKIIATIHKGGTHVIMSSHDLGQARRLADEVIFLHHGRIVEQCSADVFFAGPESQEGRAFLDGSLLW